MITRSTANDIPQLLMLVNNAYRGAEAKKGWTHEADLIDGNLRTDEATLQDLLSDENATILKYSKGNLIQGCVYLQVREHHLYLGMLSVIPSEQGTGIGKQLLAAAEIYAGKRGLNAIVMTVISQRTELISWYERRGYNKTGKTKPFHEDSRFGIPRKEIEFIIMEKKMK